MSYVETPADSRFGGLILPQETLSAMIRTEIGASYQSVRGDNKTTMAWATSMGSADADSVPYARPLSWQARDLDRNNPLAGGSIDTIVDNVVATGLRPQAQVDRKILGISEDEARAFQTEAERFFFLWANSKDGDVTRQTTFWEHQALVLINTLISGDIFTLRRFKERNGAIFGTCLQLIEADRCETPPELAATGKIVGGVETDNDGEPQRYHFLQAHPGDIFLREKPLAAQEYTSVPAYDDRGVALCLHHFARRRPDQKRGISILAPVMEQFRQLGRYTEAELTAAVVSAMFAVFVKTPQATGSVLPGTIPGQVGGQQIVPTGSGLTKLQSGMIVDLAPGEEIDVANPGRPNQAFDPFTDTVFKHIGVGLGLPKEVMLKNFVSSYSASRAAIMEAWKTFRRRRHWLVASDCQPVYEWVITEAIARGYISAPGFFDSPLRRRAWLGATWRGAPMGQLDPLKEAKAAKEWLSIPGALTIQQLTAEQFGSDYEDNLDQIGRERKQIAALPADPLAPVAPAAADTAGPPEDQE
jgi:lambda family phage portal protein